VQCSLQTMKWHLQALDIRRPLPVKQRHASESNWHRRVAVGRDIRPGMENWDLLRQKTNRPMRLRDLAGRLAETVKTCWRCRTGGAIRYLAVRLEPQGRTHCHHVRKRRINALRVQVVHGLCGVSPVELLQNCGGNGHYAGSRCIGRTRVLAFPRREERPLRCRACAVTNRTTLRIILHLFNDWQGKEVWFRLGRLSPHSHVGLRAGLALDVLPERASPYFVSKTF
jgi:hypothetical protein